MSDDTRQFVLIACLVYALLASYGAIVLVIEQRRFSLRGLLIFVALFSVVVALISTLNRWPK